MMDAKYLAEIKERAESATPGPWYADGWALWDDDLNEFVELHDTDPDAQFIANARTDISALLAEVERLNAENANIRTQLDRFVETDFKIGAENATLKKALEIANITIQKLSGENYEYSTSSFQAQKQEAEKK